jgi:hypothetical protein
MPTQQRVRANEERRPARPAQQPASRGQEHPIRLLQPRPCDLPAQNGQLVPEYDDLKLLELTRTQPQRRHRERTPKQQIHQRDQHQAPSTKIANEKRDSTARRSGQQGLMPVMTGLRTRQAFHFGSISKKSRLHPSACAASLGVEAQRAGNLIWLTHRLLQFLAGTHSWFGARARIPDRAYSCVRYRLPPEASQGIDDPLAEAVRRDRDEDG